MQATSPLTRPDDVDAALGVLRAGATSAVSAVTLIGNMKKAQIPAELFSITSHGMASSIRSMLKKTNTAISAGATTASSKASERRNL